MAVTTARLKKVWEWTSGLNRWSKCWVRWGSSTGKLRPARLKPRFLTGATDINIEEDLVEEVIRIIGYDSVPTAMLSTPIPYQSGNSLTGLINRVKDALAGVGMQETISYPLISEDDLRRAGLLESDNPRCGWPIR